MSPLRLNIRDVRKMRGLTQQEVADAAGLHLPAVNRYENNRIRRIDLDILDRIATALGVEPALLLTRAPEE